MKSQRGFTLIELLIVVVIIGILASIAIPKFVNTKEKTYVAAMKSDLRNLATAEEAYFYDSTAYTTVLADLNNFSASAGVTLNVLEATPKGWSAEATHGQTARRCVIFSGGATPPPPATIEGRIVCQ
ncbi:MAG: type IV pilin protein [Gemmatimonadales bacterium]